MLTALFGGLIQNEILYSSYKALSSATSIITSTRGTALFILYIVANCKLFSIAGEEGWAAVIPFYSTYIRFKLAGKKNLFWADLACSIVASITFITSGIILILYLFKIESITDNIGLIIIPTILYIGLSIATFVLRIIMNIGLSKNFGHSGGMAVGLIFIPRICYAILAFSSKTKYIPNEPDEDEEEVSYVIYDEPAEEAAPEPEAEPETEDSTPADAEPAEPAVADAKSDEVESDSSDESTAE